MKHSAFSEANSHSVKKISCLLWNLKVQYNVQKRLLLEPIQRSPHSHTLILTIILPPMPRSHKWSIPIRFSYQNFVCMSLQSHPPWSDHTNNLIISGEQYKLWSISLCNFLQPPLTFFHLGPNILLGTLYSNTLNLCSSLRVRQRIN
jgi:hypothetical protein